MSYKELKVLKDYLEENLEKGFIYILVLLALLPILFVKKLGSSLRFYVDYRRLNDITIKNRYPILLINKTLV